VEQDEGEDVSLLGRKMGEFLADFGGGEGAEVSSLLSDADLLLERGDHAGEFLLGLNGQKVLNALMLGGNFGLELERSGIRSSIRVPGLVSAHSVVFTRGIVCVRGVIFLPAIATRVRIPGVVHVPGISVIRVSGVIPLHITPTPRSRSRYRHCFAVHSLPSY
jgi:hypothetical protein